MSKLHACPAFAAVRFTGWTTTGACTRSPSTIPRDSGGVWVGASGRLNVAVNCLDRHLATRADKVAIVWEGDDPAEPDHLPRAAPPRARLANALREIGVGRATASRSTCR